jgi:hypothetical protein
MYLLTIKSLNENPNTFSYTSMMASTLKDGAFFLLELATL